MRTMHRMLAVLVPLAVVAAACGTGAATTIPSPDLVPAASAVPAKTPKLITPPPATPLASVEPMAPAHVTGASTLWASNQGEQDGNHISGIVVNSTTESSDPRVAGKGTGHVSVDTVGTFGWEIVEMVLENEGGTWEGNCTGAAWGEGSASSLSCWLTGTGAYAGLTYYYQSTNFGTASEDEGVILPLPAPEIP